MLLAESEGDLQRVVNEFYSICKRRKLKVNAKKSKVMKALVVVPAVADQAAGEKEKDPIKWPTLLNVMISKEKEMLMTTRMLTTMMARDSIVIRFTDAGD